MPVCNGRGDGGDHCCYMAGEVCEFLVYEDDVPRCSVWNLDKWKSSRWRNAPVGQWAKNNWPDKKYTCNDWPQNIPNPETLGGLCCWKGKL